MGLRSAHVRSSALSLFTVPADSWRFSVDRQSLETMEAKRRSAMNSSFRGIRRKARYHDWRMFVGSCFVVDASPSSGLTRHVFRFMLMLTFVP